jgi:GntR family transcriptional regulator
MVLLATPQFHLDRKSPIPLYHQISSQLEAAIRSGELTADTWLESEPVLAKRLGVSRSTVRQGIEVARADGLLVREPGRGTRVTGETPRPGTVTSFFDDLRAAGFEPLTAVVAVTATKASGQLADLFGPDEALIQITRQRGVKAKGATDQPIALMRNWIPGRFAGITPEALVSEGLYSLMRGQGARFKTAHQVIGARTASAPEAVALGTDAGAAVVTLKRRSYDPAGAPLELGDHLYRADRYHYTTTIRA